jgi:hypothetical protein
MADLVMGIDGFKCGWLAVVPEPPARTRLPE